MGYACPVCSDPQADAGHLANHLAFTAMLGDDDHEAWLDEHAPGWGEMGEADLADAVVDHVTEAEFPQVFEDTAGGLDDAADPPAERSGALFDDDPSPEYGHDHGTGRDDAGHGHGHAHGQGSGGANEHGSGSAQPPGGGGRPMDDEAEAILAEAREMTRRMLEDETDDGADETDDTGPAGDEDAQVDATRDADAGADNNE